MTETTETVRELKASVTIDEKGELRIETNLPLLETALLLQEGATYFLQQLRTAQYTSEPVKEA